MKYAEVKGFKDTDFLRLTGVKRRTFARMLEILGEAHREKHKQGGRRNKLSLADMLLMSLCYIREYRTYFHVSCSYGVSESTAYKTIVWVEDTLIKHPDFSLPGKKALAKSEMKYELILLDVTESPIERPKKNSGNTTRVKRKSTP